MLYTKTTIFWFRYGSLYIQSWLYVKLCELQLLLRKEYFQKIVLVIIKKILTFLICILKQTTLWTNLRTPTITLPGPYTLLWLYHCLYKLQNMYKHFNISWLQMWKYMESAQPTVFVKNYEQGIKRVKKGNYAFLMESTVLDYVVQVK